jgi:flagellar hook assembly protein FlgD
MEENPGENIKYWDGLNDNGILLSDDSYIVKVIIKDFAGNSIEKSMIVTIDTTKPETLIISPLEDENLEGSINIEGTSDDENFYNYSINITGKDYTNKNSIFTVPKINDTLLLWDTGTLSGQYNITLIAEDLAGNRNSKSINVNLINDLTTTILSVGLLTGNLISQKQDKIIAYFGIRTNANIDIVVKRESGEAVKIIYQNVSFRSNIYIFTWGGKDNYEQNVVDGKYIIEIKTTTSQGIENKKILQVTVDKNPPQIVIDSPAEGNYVKGVLEIKGNIIEPNLYEYVIEYGLGETPKGFIYINSKHSVSEDSILAMLDTRNLLNNKYKLRIRAKDLGENESVINILVNIDNKPPLVEITSPKENQKISGNFTEIRGTVFDENFEEYEISYAPITNQNLWQTITKNYEPAQNEELGI